MTVERMGRWSVIVEGANTYSPDPDRKVCRARMERAVYRQRGVLIATDYLINSGGVIFAAQERFDQNAASPAFSRKSCAATGKLLTAGCRNTPRIGSPGGAAPSSCGGSPG